MRKNCILELDSPSYLPELPKEYVQCGCKLCVAYLKRHGYNHNGEFILPEPKTAAGSLD